MKCFYIILFSLFVVTQSKSPPAHTKTNNLTSSKPTSDVSSKKPPPAIIAIEIVDPNENSTSAKNSKRTIDSALGYGYNTYDTSKPRYEVYKYSQHDIPSYKKDASTGFKPSKPFNPVNIQQSIQYTLPTITQHIPNAQSELRPGTTLYSSLSAQGHVGGLTSSLSKVSDIEQNGSPVPVIVLRIYPDQLKDSTIQANLPDNHPFSKSINSIDIQSLLSQYIKALRNPSYKTAYAGQAQYTSERTKGTYQMPNNIYQQQYQAPQYYTQPSYSPDQYQNSQHDSENYQYYRVYPEQQHYQNVQNFEHQNEEVQVQEAPAKYHFRYESTTPQKPVAHQPTVQVAQEPQQQHYYVTPSNYHHDQAQYYQTHQEHPAEHQQYQQQYESVHQYYSPPRTGSQDDEKLLTGENYPSDKHTKVIFRTKAGGIRTSQHDSTSQSKVKTIKIHVPNNIAKVEVQESEKAYQRQPEHTYAEQQPAVADPYQQNVGTSDQQTQYYVVDQPQEYYAPSKNSSGDEEEPNYQHVDYDQMIRYFQQRGAMPGYFYQNPEDEAKDSKPSSNDVVAAYEDAAFPSTTRSPEKKRYKGKKRT